MQMIRAEAFRIWLRRCLMLASCLICGGQAEKILADPVRTETTRPQREVGKTQFKSLKDDISWVSIVAVLANPKAFHKREVEFVAYLNLEFEGNALYLSPTDAKHGITPNAISLDYPLACERSGGNMKYVFVRGEFVADKGARGLYAGTLSRPTICQIWSVSASEATEGK